MCHKVVGVIVEGESDEKVLKEIFSKYGLNAEFRQARGFNARKFNSLGRRLKESGCGKVIILRDTECKKKEDRREELREKINELERGIEVCFAQCALEAWLLADEKAIEVVEGKEVKEIPEPESLKDPKEVMKDIFRKARGFKLGYNAPRHAPKIAHEMDVGKLEQKCDSFREMINIARD